MSPSASSVACLVRDSAARVRLRDFDLRPCDAELDFPIHEFRNCRIEFQGNLEDIAWFERQGEAAANVRDGCAAFSFAFPLEDYVGNEVRQGDAEEGPGRERVCGTPPAQPTRSSSARRRIR